MATPPGFRIPGCRGVRGFANYGFRVSRVRFSGFPAPTWALPARGFEDSRILGFRDLQLRVARKMDSGIPSFRDCEISNSGSRAKWIQGFRYSRIQCFFAPLVSLCEFRGSSRTCKYAGRSHHSSPRLHLTYVFTKTTWTCTSAAGRVVLASVIHVLVV